MPLPQTCRWVPSDDGAVLHCHFVCIAACYADGRLWVARWGREGRLEARAASQRQAMRYVERMIEVRGIPWTPRSRHGRRGHRSRIPVNAAPQVTWRLDTATEWAEWSAEVWQASTPFADIVARWERSR